MVWAWWWLLEALARCSRSSRSFSFSTKLVFVPVLAEGNRVSRLWALGCSLGGMGGGGGGGAGVAVGVGTVTKVGPGAGAAAAAGGTGTVVLL